LQAFGPITEAPALDPRAASEAKAKQGDEQWTREISN
jgi:hypothetical protein